jgi:ABC-type transport system substrate-binding protein
VLKIYEPTRRSWKWLVLLLIFLVVAGITYLLVVLLRPGTTISVQIARAPVCLDPARMSSYEEKLIDAAIYDTLVRYDPQKKTCQGVLAEKWVVAPGGKVYTFYLRQDIRFQNGRHLTAADVKYSWERVLNPKQSDYGYLLENVNGVGGIEAVNDHTLKVSLKEADYTFPEVVSSPALAIVNRQTVEHAGVHYGKPDGQTVGTGPFYLWRWDKNALELHRNTKFAGSVRFKTLRFLVADKPKDISSLFQQGKIDIITAVPAQFTMSKGSDVKAGIEVFKKPVLSFYFLGFRVGENTSSQSRQLREAINLALDRQTICRQLLGESGRPLTRIIPAEMVAGQPVPETSAAATASKDQSLQCLAVAGYPYGLHLPAVSYTYNGSPGHENLARLMQNQLGRVGIGLKLNKVSWQQYLQKISNGSDTFFRLGWESDYADPGNILFSNFASSQLSSNNYTGYQNKSLDDLLRQARSQPNPAQRDQDYLQAEKILLNDLPVIPLFQKVAVFILRKDVRGFDVDMLGRVDFSSLRRAS